MNQMHVRRDEVRQEMRGLNSRAAPDESSIESHMKLYAPTYPAAVHRPQFTEHNTHSHRVGII